MEFPLLQTSGDNTLVVWVNDRLGEFAVFPDIKPYSCTLWDIELLVPETASIIQRAQIGLRSAEDVAFRGSCSMRQSAAGPKPNAMKGSHSGS